MQNFRKYKHLNDLGTLKRRLHYDYHNSLPARRNFTTVNINKQRTLAVTFSDTSAQVQNLT